MYFPLVWSWYSSLAVFRVLLQHAVRACQQGFCGWLVFSYVRLQGVASFLSLAFSILAFIPFPTHPLAPTSFPAFILFSVSLGRSEYASSVGRCYCCNGRPGHWAKDCRVPLPATSNRNGVYYSSWATVVRPGRRKLKVIEVIMFCFSQLSEVKETCEFEESSGTALSQVKGS